MTAKSSFSRVTARQHPSRHIRGIAIVSSLLALVSLVIGVLSFTRANELMRQPAKPLDTFSSNVLPPFNLAGFPSLDEQTTLSGWFFPAKGTPVSTIILVHDQGKNRLQFDLDSARFYEFLLDRGFSVLAFDLRNSGQSGGEMSGYGYAEWSDVLAAIRYVRKNSVTRDVLLFGFGTGVAASLIALDRLPPAGTVASLAAADSAEQAAAQAILDKYPKAVRELGFDQAYIRGLLLDTPCDSPDEYIRSVCRQEGWFGRSILQYTVPYAVRLSAGSTSNSNLITILTRSQLPVFLTFSQQAAPVAQESIMALVKERQRLHPDTTAVFTNPQPGYTTGFLQDQDDYLTAMQNFLERYFSS